jgi:GT2 family glycosyltransferase
MINNQKELTISLISHNSKKDLELLLPSLFLALSDISAEILLIDNCSDDSTIEFIKRNYPEIFVRKNKSRLGYGANHNQNLAIAKGKFIVLMNADMVLTQESLFLLLKFMDRRHSDIGIVAPRVLNEDGTLQYLNKRYPGILDLFLRRFVPDKLKYLFDKRLGYYEMRDVGYDSIIDVPFLSGAFMFCRTDLIKAVSGFDERYFLYFEDVDLCRRVQKTHRTVYYPDAVVTHRWGRAAHKNLKWTIVFMKSAVQYFNKWGCQLF